MPTMYSGLGGPAGYGENVFSSTTKHTGNNDDGTIQIDITSVFGPGGLTFFGSTYTEVYVNSNGFISFGSPDDAFNTSGMASISSPALVPFFSDVDITEGGEIYWDIDTTNGRITVTWHGVQPFGGGTGNDFQVVITDLGGGEFDVEYIYESITWTSSISGPVAVAGYTDGNSTDVEFDGSGNAAEMANYESNDFGGGDPVGTFLFIPMDGVVNGTVGDDSMASGFSDAEGDAITTGADLIDGGAGNDDIDGDAGDDTLIGGAGNDTLRSGEDAGALTWIDVAANEVVTGTTGPDYYRWLATNGANSTIRLNNSANPDDGDSVADYILVASTNQTGTLTVGDFDIGTDRIVLQQNYTGVSVSGGGANYTDVTLTYSGGNQQSYRIYHQGAFSLSQVFTTTPPVPVSDNDSLDGGADADTFVLTDGFGSDTISGGEATTTGTDFDTIDLSALTVPVTATFTGTGAGSATDGTDTLTFTGIERLILTEGADVVDASADGSSLEIVAHGGDDGITGGWGNDTIFGGAGNDTIIDGAGHDTVLGGDGDDVIGDPARPATGEGNDLLEGGAGNDTISGGWGSDTIRGGDGEDLLHEGSVGNAAGEVYGEAGNDTIFGGTGSADDLLSGGDGNDLIIDQGQFQSDGGFSNDTLLGGAGDDTLIGSDGDNVLDGGDGADVLLGGDGNDIFVYGVGLGDDTISDFNTGNTGTLSDGDTTNNDFIDLSSFYDTLSELYADQADDGILNQSNATDSKGRSIDYSDNAQFGAGDSLTFPGASADASSFSSENTAVVCFGSGTLILTPTGEVPVEHLRAGDLVVTRDNGPQPLCMVVFRRLGPEILAARPEFRPILIKTGVAGNARDLVLSPQHAVVVRGASGAGERLMRATHLARCRTPGVRVMQGCLHIDYYHLILERHEIVFSNGIASESFFPGPLAMASLTPDVRQSMCEAFPELRNLPGPTNKRPAPWDSARPYVKRRDIPGRFSCSGILHMA